MEGFEPPARLAAPSGFRIRTLLDIMTGSVNLGNENASQSLQMEERPLMKPDDLKSMNLRSFIVINELALNFPFPC